MRDLPKFLTAADLAGTVFPATQLKINEYESQLLTVLPASGIYGNRRVVPVHNPYDPKSVSGI